MSGHVTCDPGTTCYDDNDVIATLRDLTVVGWFDVLKTQIITTNAQ